MRSKASPSFSARRRDQGFTLIEIMVVVVIIGILAAVVVPAVLDKPDKARVTAAKADIHSIESALAMYKLDNFNYPSTQQGLQALVTKPSGQPEAANWNPSGYLKSVPKDPWGHDYVYLSPGTHGDIDIMSYGSDGRQGGEGTAADIGNWDQSK